MKDQNYFEIFGLTPKFAIDAGKLKRAFIKLSREYHPDFYTQASDEKQEEILASSTLLNDAYAVLKSDVKRMHYILNHFGVMGAEGENKLPQSFLMEMMDINEAIMDIQMDYSEELADKAKKDVDQLSASMLAEVQEDMDAFDEDTDVGHLEKVKDYYLKQKYLVRIKENLDTFASGKVRM